MTYSEWKSGAMTSIPFALQSFAKEKCLLNHLQFKTQAFILIAFGLQHLYSWQQHQYLSIWLEGLAISKMLNVI